MKKLLLFTFVFSKVIAQTEFKNQNDYNGFYSANTQNFYVTLASALSQKKLKSYSQTSLNNQREYSYELFDENGRVLEEKSGQLLNIIPFGRYYEFSHNFFEYDKYNNMILRKSKNKNGETVYQAMYYYRQKNKLDSSIIYIKQIKRRSSHVAYSNNDKPLSNHFYEYKKERKTTLGRYEFEYYENGNRKQTRAYNKKNKITHVWNYECDEKGKLEFQKNTTQLCVSSGLDNNGKQFEVFFQKHKNYQTKTVSTFYKLSDSIKFITKCENYIIYKGKEDKTSMIHYADSIEPYYEHIVYNKNNGISFSEKTVYSTYLTNKKIIKSKTTTSFDKGKISFEVTESYNDKGLPQEQISKNNKGKIISKTIYSFLGDSVYKHETYNKKGKMINGTVTKLVYFN